MIPKSMYPFTMRKSKFHNIAQLQARREIDDKYIGVIKEQFYVTDNFVNRLGLIGELKGHTGCVNCLEWNSSGQILASGSDDCYINLYDPFRQKLLTSIPSAHTGNIFTIKFVPNTEDRKIISGAADHSVKVHDIIGKEILSVCTCHGGRIKRIVTDITTPLFWSAGEDGLIIQHDLRVSHTCVDDSTKSPENVLLDLKQYIGSKAEAKCLAINPIRPVFLAVGANDPYLRLYDRRFLKLPPLSKKEGGDGKFLKGTVQYFVAGHLPSKITEYKKKFRSLASTYCTFSPDGNELLVNLGGEQIYLFPLQPDLQCKITKVFTPGESMHEGGDCSKNGFVDEVKQEKSSVLTPQVLKIKESANEAYISKKFARAIHLYNLGIKMQPNSSILCANRAAALIERGWDGDFYVAMKDSIKSITIDPEYYKAHLRLSRCFFELQRYNEAASYLKYFKERFPDEIDSRGYNKLQESLEKALKINSSTSSSPSTPPPSSDHISSYFFNRSNSNSTNDEEENSSESFRTLNNSSKRVPEFFGVEKALQSDSIDFCSRYLGHCNTTTDIKEGNYFGNYIVAGSDDGSFFIWDKETTNIVKIIKGDESIVNCLQPHPTTCLLATSGIESVVKLWAPLSTEEPKLEEGEILDSILDSWSEAASANQQRMNSNPFELILMNMGYRITGGEEDEERDDGGRDANRREGRNESGNGAGGMQCNPS